jgi:thioredoxin-related protein
MPVGMLFTAACSAPEVPRNIPEEFLGGEAPEPENAFKDWISIEQAVSQASRENKKILVDVYTDWCGYCKKMKSETYTENRVQSAISENFYAVKINAESGEMINYGGEQISMQEFAMNLGVTSFPTTIFLTPDGEPLGFQPGFIDSETFERLLVYVGDDVYDQDVPFNEFTLD